MDVVSDLDIAKMYSVVIDSIDFSDVGLCNCGTGGDIEYINRSFADIFILGDEPESFTGKKINTVVEEFDRIIEQLSPGKTTKGIEFSIKREALQKWLLINSHLLKENRTGKESVLYIVRDITFYKKLQIEFLKAGKIFSSLIGFAEDIIYRLDPEGKIVFISESIRKYGYTPDELLGTHILDIVHPDDREKASYRLNERRAGERKTALFEVQLLVKDTGEGVEHQFENRRDVRSQFFLVTAEGLYIPDRPRNPDCFFGTQGIARDVTGHRCIEIKLKDTESKWRDILNTLQDGFYEVDLEGNFTLVNNAFIEILGIGLLPDDLYGKNYSEIFSPENRKKLFEAFNTLYKMGAVKIVDLTVIREDGRKRHIEGSISLIRNQDGESSGFRGITRDITEKIRLEQDLSRAKKLESIGILAGGIAHDFNNALTAIMGNLSLAKMDIPDANRDLLEIIEDAEAASVTIMDLTKKLSNFARGGRPVKKTLNIEDSLCEVSNSVFSDFQGEYTISIEDDLVHFDADEVQIRQALENILQNSIDAVDNKGKISISAVSVDVREQIDYSELTLYPGRYVLVSIEDNGQGIKEEDLDKIFDPYFSTKETGGGMGLATSFAVIKRHHGYINVKSSLNEGTGFYIYLPVDSG